jgi:hypothetical protein
MLRQQALPYMGVQAVLIAVILSGVMHAVELPFTLSCTALVHLQGSEHVSSRTWTGTNIYYPDAWLATAAVCSAVLCAEIAYIMVMQRVCALATAFKSCMQSLHAPWGEAQARTLDTKHAGPAAARVQDRAALGVRRGRALACSGRHAAQRRLDQGAGRKHACMHACRNVLLESTLIMHEVTCCV